MRKQISVELLAAQSPYVGIAPLIVGVVIAIVLIGALWLGRRLRQGEPPPSQDVQPRSGAWQNRHESDDEAMRGDHGPGHQDSQPHEHSEMREPDQLRTEAGRRRLPHELENQGSHTSEDQDPRRWDEGKSGSFGSG
jgi:hypothetical protein